MTSKSVYEELLIHRASIYDKAVSSNSLGEQIETWSLSKTGIKCRVNPLSAEEVNSLSGKYDNLSAKIYILSSQSITTDNELVYNGNRYYVNEVLIDSSGYTKKVIVGVK
jgi:hypothetical protein